MNESELSEDNDFNQDDQPWQIYGQKVRKNNKNIINSMSTGLARSGSRKVNSLMWTQPKVTSYLTNNTKADSIKGKIWQPRKQGLLNANIIHHKFWHNPQNSNTTSAAEINNSSGSQVESPILENSFAAISPDRFYPACYDCIRKTDHAGIVRHLIFPHSCLQDILVYEINSEFRSNLQTSESENVKEKHWYLIRERPLKSGAALKLIRMCPTIELKRNCNGNLEIYLPILSQIIILQINIM